MLNFGLVEMILIWLILFVILDIFVFWIFMSVGLVNFFVFLGGG